MINSKLEKQKKIKLLMIQYYKQYYKDILGLPNYQQLIFNRLDEDNNVINIISQYMCLIPFYYESEHEEKKY